MDNTFWATVALIIFIGVVLYLKVPAMIGKALDERANSIRGELDEARRLREEAQQLLAEYQRKRKEAEKDAADIVAAAKREADMLLDEAHKKTEDYVDAPHRACRAEDRPGRARRGGRGARRARSTSPSRRRASCSPTRSTPRPAPSFSRRRFRT